MSSSTQTPDRPLAGHAHPGHGAPQPGAQTPGQKPSCACSRLTWPRRWHALVGGALMLFLLAHLGASALGLSPAAFTRAAGALESLLALAPALILSALFLLFAYQMGSGLFLVNHHGMKYNVNKCNRGGKPRFFAQRVTGLVIFVFVLAHVATLHDWGLHALYRLTHWQALERWAAGGLFQPEASSAFASAVTGVSQAWGSGAGGWNHLLASLTLVGALSAAYHAANGIWSGGILWKLAPTPRSKKVLGGVVIAAMTVFTLLACAAWWAFTFAPAARAALIR